MLWVFFQVFFFPTWWMDLVEESKVEEMWNVIGTLDACWVSFIISMVMKDCSTALMRGIQCVVGCCCLVLLVWGVGGNTYLLICVSIFIEGFEWNSLWWIVRWVIINCFPSLKKIQYMYKERERGIVGGVGVYMYFVFNSVSKWFSGRSNCKVVVKDVS